jgi:hypothetical protein
LATSAALNALAFAAHADGLLVYPAAMLAFAVPGLAYSLTRVGAALALD